MHRFVTPLVAVAALLAGCDPSVAPRNPYDPATPPELQAKAALRGRLVTPVLGSLQGLQVGLRFEGRALPAASADASGAFVFAQLTPGDYEIVVSPVGFAPLTLGARLRAGQDLDLGDVDLTPLTGALGSEIRGRVTLEGVVVDLSGSLVEAVGAAYTAVTDSSGDFRLALIPGTHSLRFSHPSFQARQIDGIVVGSGETFMLPADVLLSVNPAHVTGHVDGEAAGAAPAPLSGATVSADGASGVTLTGPSGDFQLDLPAGSYLVRVRKAGYADTTVPVLALAGGETRPVGSLLVALARGGISGRVALADGGDPAGTVVEVTGASRATVAAADGGFTIEGLVVGVYEITARRDGYSRAVQGSLSVTEGAVTSAGTLTLARQGGAVTILEAPHSASRTVSLQLSATGVTHYRASEDSTFTDPAKGDTASDWHPIDGSPSYPFTLVDADGAHTVHVAFSNGGVSPSATFSAQVVLDRRPPETPSLRIGDGSGWSRSATGLVSLSLEGQDLPAVSGAEASGLGKVQLVNGTDFSAPGVATYDYNTSVAWVVAAPGTDGQKTVSVRVLDRAGNVSAATAASVVVDTQPPSSPSLVLAGPDPTRPGYTTTPFVTATVSAADANGGTGSQALFVKLSNDGGFVGATYQPFAPALNWILAAGDGDKTVHARFMDPAGNESIPVQATISLRSSGPTAPTLSILEKDTRQNGSTNSRAVNLRLDAVGQAVLARVAENPALTGGTDVSLVGVTLPWVTPDALGIQLADADGLRTLWVRYYDAAGNASELAAAAVTLDRVAPQALAPALSSSPTAITAASLTPPSAGQDELQLAGAGVVPVSWSAAPAGVPFPFTLTSGDGAKSFTVTWRDLADNVSAAVPLSLLLDGTAPIVPGTFAVSGTLGDGTASTSFAASTGVTLNLSTGFSDATSGISQVLVSNRSDFADAGWVPYVASSAVPWTLPPGDGPPVKTVWVRVRDAAGNTSAATSGSIDLRATPPSGGSIVVAGGATDTNSPSPTAAISATGATEMRIAVNGVAVTAGPGGWATYATSTTLPFAAEGAQLVSVRFRNAARVEGAGATTGIRYDVTAPAAPTVDLVGSRGDGLVEPSGTWTAVNPVSVSVPGSAGPAIDTDVASMMVAQSTSAASCVFPAGAVWQPYVAGTTLLLTGADGTKRVCARLRDRAGNVGPAGSDAIALDTTPPTNPSFSDLSTTVTSATSVTGRLVAASADPAPGSATPTYQCYASPAAPQWADCTPGAGLSFTFPLTANAPNVVGVRARDDAWNVSTGTLVSVVQDSVAPLPPNIVNLETTRDSIAVTWDASPDADVVSYRLYYGNAAGDLAGTGAAQGASPVLLAATGTAVQSFSLTGLGTSLPYYVAVEAVDRAGNGSGPSGQRFAQPNRTNARLLSTFGGEPRSVGIRTAGALTFAYATQNLGVVQLDVSVENQLPRVTGRASLPDFVPDESAPVAVFDCQRTTKTGTVSGHCVVAPGSTLEGDYRGDRDAYRAPAPVVFFPAAGGPGVLVSVLPARPHRVAVATVGGNPVLLTVERTGVKAFDMTRIGAPRLLASYALDLQTVTAAGMGWGTLGLSLLVFAPPAYAGTPGYAPSLHEIGLANVWSGTLTRVNHGSLQDHLGRTVGAAGLVHVPIIGDNQLYVAYRGTDGIWIAQWSPGGSTPWDWQRLTTDSVAYNQPLAGVAGNMRVYVFVDQDWWAASPPNPYAYQIYSDGGLTVTGALWGVTNEARHGAIGVYTASGTADTEHVFSVDRDPASGRFSLERWRVNDGTHASTYTAYPFREVSPQSFAESDGFLFVPQDTSIFTIDTSNPLNQRVASTFTGATPYDIVKVHGRYLWAAWRGNSAQGIDAFRIGGNGTLTYVGEIALPGGYILGDFVIRGRYAYLAMGWIRVYEVTNPAAPIYRAVTPGSVGCYRLDVRPGVSGVTTYEGIVHCAIAGGYSTPDQFQTFGYDGAATLTTLSSAVNLPNDYGYWHPTHVTLAGSHAVVSNTLGAHLVVVSTPSSPYLSSTSLTSGGPVLSQGGYLVGLGRAGAASGPDFLQFANGQGDGTLLFSTCSVSGTGEGSLASRDGVYWASCGRNGSALFAAPSRRGGTLLKRHDVSQAWNGAGGAAFATDGSFSYLAGPEFPGELGRLYSVDERYNSYVVNYGPSYYSGNLLPGNDAAFFFLLQDGVLHTFGGFSNNSSLNVRSLVPANPSSVWPSRGTYSVPIIVGQSNGPWNAQPVADGERAYASRNNYLEAYDLRAAPTLAASVNLGYRAGALALARDRLYAGHGSGRTVRVYDTSSGGFAAPLTSLTLRTAVNAITGLAVQGSHLFVTYASTDVLPYGLAVYLLSAANRDGAGAVLLADFPSALPLGSPTVSGDTLYATANLGLASWDLMPLWRDGSAPVALSTAVSFEPIAGRSRLVLDGPWAYVLGGSYRAFDLRQ